MYRKFKENKDNEYETIIRKQVQESRLVAEQEGITIPKTLDDYVAPSRAGALGKNGKKSGYSSFPEDDVDLGIDVSERKDRRVFEFIDEFRMMMIKWVIWVMKMMDLMMKAIETYEEKANSSTLFCSVCQCRNHYKDRYTLVCLFLFFSHNYYFSLSFSFSLFFFFIYVKKPKQNHNKLEVLKENLYCMLLNDSCRYVIRICWTSLLT